MPGKLPQAWWAKAKDKCYTKGCAVKQPRLLHAPVIDESHGTRRLEDFALR